MGAYANKYRSFYESREWRALRTQVMISNSFLCVSCKSKGLIVSATQVHHIVPIDKDMSKALDYDNLKPLCSNCHNEAHDRQSALSKFMNVDRG